MFEQALSVGVAPHALQRLESGKRFRRIASALVGVVCLVLVAMLLLPWQQTVVGTGKVTVFSQGQRPQSIQASMSGRLKRWLVQEGSLVSAGQVVAELAETDQKLLNTQQPELLAAQKAALQTKQQATLQRIASLQGQLAALGGSQSVAVPSAGVKIAQSQQRTVAAQQALRAAQQQQQTANYQFHRIQTLYQKGLRSQREFELAQQDWVRSQTETQRALTAVTVAQQEQRIGQLDQAKVNFDLNASQSSVSANLATAQEALATLQGDLLKLEVESTNLGQRVQQRLVKAPQSGQLTRVTKFGAGEMVAEGEALATIIPVAPQDQAVELLISDWDAPLVALGRPVRLEFAGFPALQFSGWPSVATGTFGGKVAIIDGVDDGKGQYRVLVQPQQHRGAKDAAWPNAQHLRPGTEANGWILLDEVPLWYELWRQFNGFRPIVQEPTAKGSAKEKADDPAKPPKRKKK
jgi:multidrug efflux pump subunit AcrA (membrane-fusion protein)